MLDGGNFAIFNALRSEIAVGDEGRLTPPAYIETRRDARVTNETHLHAQAQ